MSFIPIIFITIWICNKLEYKKKAILLKSKNLIRYRSENNFVGSLGYIFWAITAIVY